MVDILLDSTQEQPKSTPIGGRQISVDHFHIRLGTQSRKWRPPTDVYETEDAILVKVEIAGMKEADFLIILSQKKITIQGNREQFEVKRAYHQMEIRSGGFSTEVELHWPVDSESVEAEYKDGFLKITLPKLKPHQITIDE